MTAEELSAFAKHYLYAFPKLASGNKCPPHIKYISDVIQETISKKNTKDSLLIISVPPRFGKPLWIETLVTMGDGTLRKIGDIKEGDFVFTHLGRSKKVLKVYEQGELDCVEIETQSGRKTIPALTHPFLTPEGWFSAKDLKVGMYLTELSMYKDKDFKNTEEELCAARLAGYFVGDGTCTYKSNPQIACADSIEVEDITFCVETLGFEMGYCSNSINFNILPGQEVKKWLDKIGLHGHNSHTKRIPEFVFKGSNKLIANFVGAYFSCDGTINKRGGTRKDACVEFYSVNKDLLKDTQHLLLRLGIQSTLRLKNGRYKGKRHISYRLAITSQDYIKKFSDIVPIYGIKRKTLNEWPYYRQTFDYPYITDKIVKITTGLRCECRCLLVEDDHTFIANDFIVHNTELISKHFVPWYLGNNPKKRIILTSYSAELSSDNSGAARDIFERWGDILWDIKPHKSIFSKAKWNTEFGGGVVSAGIGGSITGFGADVLIIDDYIKGAEEAESKLQNDKIWEWWQSVASSRLHPNSTTIILCTRWVSNDLIGKLLQQKEIEKELFPFKIRYINLPALCEDENDPLNRKVGDSLWPAKFSREWLLNKKTTAGPYWWAAQYQGNPVIRGGNLFKSEWFRYYERDKNGDWLCYRPEQEPIRIFKRELRVSVTVDPALEMKRKNDPSCMLAWGYSRKKRVWLLLDRLNKKIDHHLMMNTIKSFAFKNNAIQCFIENEKLGKILIKQSEGRDEVSGVKIPFREVKTKQIDKYARATPMASYYENQRVFHPKNAPWIANFESSLSKFPTGANDEDADCTAYAQYLERGMTITDALSNRRYKNE